MKCSCGKPVMKARQTMCLDCADAARRAAQSAYRKKRRAAAKTQRNDQDLWLTTMQRRGVRHV
jgi:hypothetical protein